MYLIAIFLPPLAVLLCGKPIQALICLVLTVLGWVPGVIHALFVVNAYKADQRNALLIKAVEQSRP